MIYKCLYDFCYRDLDTGLYHIVKKNENFKVVKFDEYEQKVHLQSVNRNDDVIISVYKFTSAFCEVDHVVQ